MYELVGYISPEGLTLMESLTQQVRDVVTTGRTFGGCELDHTTLVSFLKQQGWTITDQLVNGFDHLVTYVKNPEGTHSGYVTCERQGIEK